MRRSKSSLWLLGRVVCAARKNKESSDRALLFGCDPACRKSKSGRASLLGGGREVEGAEDDFPGEVHSVPEFGVEYSESDGVAP